MYITLRAILSSLATEGGGDTIIRFVRALVKDVERVALFQTAVGHLKHSLSIDVNASRLVESELKSVYSVCQQAEQHFPYARALATPGDMELVKQIVKARAYGNCCSVR